jgi:hypothetical protein
MYIVMAVVLVIALSAAWEAYGPKAVLKTIAWTVGGGVAAIVLITVAMELNAR